MRDSSQRLVFVDYLRGVAIICVFLYHCLYSAYGIFGLPWQWLHRGFLAPASFIALLPVHFGFFGVPMFFVISGFCIHLSFKQQGQEWGSFFIRRFFRIYPAYLAALLLFLMFSTHDLRDFWFQFKYHALLIHNFNHAARFALNGSFWSIAVEVQLYLIYPVLLWLVAKFGWKRTLIGLAACEMFLDLWDNALYQITAFSGYISPFLLGKVSPFVEHYIIPSPLSFWFSWSLGGVRCRRVSARTSVAIRKIISDILGLLDFSFVFYCSSRAVFLFVMRAIDDKNHQSVLNGCKRGSTDTKYWA